MFWGLTTGACGLHVASAPEAGLYEFIPGTSGKLNSTMSGYQEQSDSLAPKQAALNAVLADWTSATSFANTTTYLLEKGTTDGILRHSSIPDVHDLDEFWSVDTFG